MPIYFAESGNFIKIGYTEDLWNRLAAIQHAVPDYVDLLGIVDGDRAKEREVHQLFKSARHRGEWFRRTDGLLDFINSSPHVDFPPPDKYEYRVIFRGPSGWFIGVCDRARGPFRSRSDAQKRSETLSTGKFPKRIWSAGSYSYVVRNRPSDLPALLAPIANSALGLPITANP